MRPLLLGKAAKVTAQYGFVLALGLGGGAGAAIAQTNTKESDAGSSLPALMTREKSSAATSPKEELFLSVFINNLDTKKLLQFRRYQDGCLTAMPEDLQGFNLKIPETARHDGGGICLERMPGVTYRYDVNSQSIYIKVLDDARVSLDFDAQRRRAKPTANDQDLSAVFNYTLFASAGANDVETNYYPSYQGVSATLDGRVFSKYGVFDQSLTTNSTATELTPNLIRLDTRWLYEDPDTLITYSAGDVISGALNWTNAIRMGGVQIRRDFMLRPDLITTPVQQFSGSAAVPSTVQVFDNQTRLLSQDISGGPFNINNIPLITGPGTMRIVLRDATGKETVSEYAYYNSTNLLAPGLFDYSVETGFARYFYGLYSSDYDGSPIASASARYGVTPSFTVEGHAEGGAGLSNLGGGVDFGLWQYGVASLALAGSDYNGALGGQGYGSFETAILGARLMLRTQRGFGEYEDLASATASKCPAAITGCTVGNYAYKSKDQVSLSIPLRFDESSINLSYTDSVDYSGNANKIAALSYSRPFYWDRSTISLNVFNDFENAGNFGAYAAITFAWDKYTASALADSDGKTYAAGGSLSRALGQEPGSYGYNLTAMEGPQPYNSASASYRASAFQATAGVIETGKSVQATAQVDGAVAILHGVHFANRIDNSFAVVDTGIPNARVLYENNPIGETDSGGTLLIPSMRAREQNAIAIDPASLPVQADMPETKQTVVPAARGGMTVRFKGEAAPPSAMVSFKDGKGEWLPVGSEVWVNGGEASFPIGYDGEAYLTGLGAANTTLVKKPDGTPCNASFAFAPNGQAQVRIEGVVCTAEESGKIAMQTGGETVVAKR